MELVFDESQKESDHEIWINVYPLTMFLSRHQSEAAKRKDFPVSFFVFPLQNLKCYDKMGLDRNDKKITIYKMKGFGGEKQWQEK